jgi:hypothetical protein
MKAKPGPEPDLNAGFKAMIAARMAQRRAKETP